LIACAVGGIFYLPLLWGMLVPVAIGMAGDWKRFNEEEINKGEPL
jgi:membrane protein CcdC involved in cytochrome C biogenesis